MNIYDCAHTLARALKESDEYRSIVSAMNEIEAEPEAKRMLDDFRTKQMDLQNDMMQGKMPTDEDNEKMEKLFQLLSLNPQITKLFESERKLSVMMDDMNKIITEPLKDIYES